MKLKTLTKQITTLALTAVMATTMLLSPANVSAASKKAKVQKRANKAYAQAIKKNKIGKFTNYMLIDVTGDGIKELITRNIDPKSEDVSSRLNFYTYKKGKVKKIWTTSIGFILYNNKQKTLVCLISSGNGMDDNDTFFTWYDIYKYNGKKIKKTAEYYQNTDFKINKTTYSKKVNGKIKKITKKEYKDATYDSAYIKPEKTTTRKALIKKLSK